MLNEQNVYIYELCIIWIQAMWAYVCVDILDIMNTAFDVWHVIKPHVQVWICMFDL